MNADTDLLLAIYASVLEDDAFARLLTALARRFDCVSAALIYVDPGRPTADITVAYGTFADPAVRARYDREFAAIDPAPAAMARLPLGEVASTDDLFSERELVAYAPFLEGFYHPAGLGGALGAPLAKENGQLGMVAVQRGLDRAPFDRRDLDGFRALVPHLTQAIALRRTFFSIASRSEHLARTLEPMTAAVLHLSTTGLLRHANASARAVLARGDGLWLDRQGHLRARDPQTDGRLRALFEKGGRDGGSAVLRVPRDLDGPPYVLRVTARVEAGTEIGVSVLVSDPAGSSGGATTLLAEAFGLSEPAARLTAALVAGDDLRGYAARAGITLNTAKFHLKSAFAALGVKRQVDLVRLAGNLARDLPAG